MAKNRCFLSTFCGCIIPAKMGLRRTPPKRTRSGHMEGAHPPTPPKILELGDLCTAKTCARNYASSEVKRPLFPVIPVRYYKYYIATKQELYQYSIFTHKKIRVKFHTILHDFRKTVNSSRIPLFCERFSCSPKGRRGCVRLFMWRGRSAQPPGRVHLKWKIHKVKMKKNSETKKTDTGKNPIVERLHQHAQTLHLLLCDRHGRSLGQALDAGSGCRAPTILRTSKP